MAVPSGSARSDVPLLISFWCVYVCSFTEEQKLTAWWKLTTLDYHINYWSDWSDWRMCVEAEMGLMETAAELPPPSS